MPILIWVGSVFMCTLIHDKGNGCAAIGYLPFLIFFPEFWFSPDIILVVVPTLILSILIGLLAGVSVSFSPTIGPEEDEKKSSNNTG